MMNRLANLRQQLVELVDASDAMYATVESESRSLTDDERTRDDELERSIVDLRGEIDREERRLARAKSLPVAVDLTNRATGRVEVTRDAADKPWGSFGQMLSAVAYAADPSCINADPRLSAAATGMSEGVLSDGGFVVQTDHSATLRERVYSTGELLSRIAPQPMGANTNSITIPYVNETSRVDGSRSGGIQAYWEGEADLYAGSKPKIAEMTLKLKKLTGLVYATDELLADAVALEGFINREMSRELRFKAEDAVINGTGAGQPLGILQGGCIIEVAKEGSQTATTIVTANLRKMYGRLYSPSKANAVWLCNTDCLEQLLALEDGNGNALVQFDARVSPQYQTIFGRPVIETEYNATLGTAGDIVLADLSQYLLADKGGVQTAASMHVRFLYGEQAFRFTWRLDGQPSWRTALTPFKGSNTLSPFVSLAVRS